MTNPLKPSPDMIVGWDAHLKNGNIYRVEIQLPMKDDRGGEEFLDVCVDVIAPNRDLACYIVSTMYPDYDSMCSDDRPLSA